MLTELVGGMLGVLFMNSEVLPSCRFSPFVRVFMVLSLRGFVFKMSVVFSDVILCCVGEMVRVVCVCPDVDENA